MKAKFREMEENTREGGISRIMKELLVFVQFITYNKRFLVQFEYRKKRYISYGLLSYVCSKEEIGE